MTLRRLSELQTGNAGTIEKFDENDAKVKLMEMGCIPGETIAVEAIAPMGDPMAIHIAGYSLSLRKTEAAHIWVRLND